jgi:hypothetical protein
VTTEIEDSRAAAGLSPDDMAHIVGDLLAAAGPAGIGRQELERQTEIAVEEVNGWINGAALYKHWSEGQLKLRVHEGEVQFRFAEAPEPTSA